MNRLDAMAVLLAVVDQGSFSAAARSLRLPLATVSRKVAELENHLGIRILNRTTRRIEITDQGRGYIAACRRVLQDLEEIERKAAGEYSAPKGKLNVTAPLSFGRLHLLPIVNSFLMAYPDIDVTLQLADRVVDLLEEHIDASLRIGKLSDTGLKAVRVGEVRMMLCASPDYLKRRGTPRKLDELTKHDCVTLQSLMSPIAWQFQNGRRKQLVTVHTRLAVPIAEAAEAAAVAGVGITRLLSYQVADAIQQGRLIPLLPQFEPPPLPIHLLHVHEGHGVIPQKLRAFLDFTVPRLKKVLQ
jgi:DNA-binding transcriptional LysR family regulator